MLKYNLDDTIVAVSTPLGEGGIGIVRLSGSRALGIAGDLFVSKDWRRPPEFETYTTRYGHIVDKGSRVKRQGSRKRNTGDGRRATKNEIVDEVLLTVMRAPKSYTREDVVEINCHGGIQAVKKVLDLAMRSGARLAEPGEFTRRAFLNGRIDLAQAEAVLDTIRARTEASLKVAMSQLEGGLSGKINTIREDVLGMASEIEASIDFPEEELELKGRDALVARARDIIGRLDLILKTYDDGMVFREGVLAIICGKPNVGKSSLMNLLLKRDRVIVSPVPGTTRDTVEEVISLKGIPIRLVDTAGITESGDAIEKEGVERSKRYLKLADMILLMIDASTGITKADREVIKFADGRKKLVILNKCDLEKKIDRKTFGGFFKDDRIIEVSVTKRRGIDLVEKAILDMVWSGKFVQGEGAVVSNARHKELLDKAYRCMLSVKKALAANTGAEIVAIDLKEAVFDLGLIIGKSVSDDILDRIFGQFCIGK